MNIDPTVRLVVSYPAWNDQARALKGKMSPQDIAAKFGVKPSGMPHVLSPSWKVYCLYKKLQTMGLEPTLQECRAALNHPKCDIHFQHSGFKTRKAIEEISVGKLREFEQVSEYKDGKTLKGARITCSSCDAHETYFNHQGTVSTEHLEKEFSRRGWYVGAGSKRDVCSSCRDRRTHKNAIPINKKAEDMQTIDLKVNAAPVQNVAPFVPPVVATTTNVPAVVAQAGKMDRTERRLVFAKLNEVYGDEKTGYTGDWNDAKVAADLGVPAEWVAEVRDQDFGPELNASILADRHKEINELGERMQRTIVLIDKKLEQLQSLDDKIRTTQEEIDKTVDRFEELCKSLETEDKHIEGLVNAFTDHTSNFKKLFADFRSQPSN